MSKIIEFVGDFYRAAYVISIHRDEEKVSIQIWYASEPVEYDFDSEEEADKEVYSFVMQWKAALQ